MERALSQSQTITARRTTLSFSLHSVNSIFTLYPYATFLRLMAICCDRAWLSGHIGEVYICYDYLLRALRECPLYGEDLLNQSTRDLYTPCHGHTDIARLHVLPVYQCCVA